jgi:isocitrate dehydrogenase (NAD+)
MLNYLNEREAAIRISKALTAVIGEGKALTRDLGGQATTIDFTNAVIGAL